MFEALKLLVDGIMGGSPNQRRAISDLERMTDKELYDIGISRYDIRRVVLEGKR
jgi:hypothetical protein